MLKAKLILLAGSLLIVGTFIYTVINIGIYRSWLVKFIVLYVTNPIAFLGLALFMVGLIWLIILR